MDALSAQRRRQYCFLLLGLTLAAVSISWPGASSAADPQRSAVPARPARAAGAAPAEEAPEPLPSAKRQQPLPDEAVLREWTTILPPGEPPILGGHAMPCGNMLCGDCSPPWFARLWVRGEGLLWWTDSMGPLPALVTTSPASTPPANAGVLGNPSTTILFGGRSEDQGVHGGARITVGYDLTAGGRHALQASWLSLGEATAGFQAASPQTPVLARPYFDTLGSRQAAMLIAHPDLLQGSIGIEQATEFELAEVLWRHRLLESCDGRLDVMAGYRFARLDESLHINHFSRWTATQGVIIPDTTRTVREQFDTDNEFHGAVLGMVYHRQMGCTSLEVLMKLGLGNTNTAVVIDGITRTTVPGGGSADFAGGLLAQPTNIGRYTRDEFAVLPELGVTLSRQLTPRLTGNVGYTFLYWSQVARPGDPLDVAVSQLPPEPASGARRPEFQFASDSFWAQGLSLGLDFRF